MTTLGTGDDEQMIDALHGTLQIELPAALQLPSLLGRRSGSLGPSLGRREIGHGKLAWRALQAVLPAATDFPYTVRVGVRDHRIQRLVLDGIGLWWVAVHDGRGRAAEITVAGVAMGLILEEDGEYAILTDILGDEDHLGDMDFKVAGTENGITSLQMDIKVAGITPEIMQKALAQAKEGRLAYPGRDEQVDQSASEEFSIHAPRIETMQVPTDKIREVIGSGGKVIREIVGSVRVPRSTSTTMASSKSPRPTTESPSRKAYDMIHSIVAEPEEGKVIYKGTGCEDRRLRRLRELLRQARRTGPCQPDREPPPEPSFGRSEGRPGSESQTAWF